jgi:hypothetical protein
VTLRKCPHCTGKYRGGLALRHCGFYDDERAPAVSRRDRAHICMACSKAEGLADRQRGTLTDEMARTVAEQDKQEAMRLPEGSLHGVTYWPTGGLDEYLRQWESVYGPVKELDE